MALTRRRALLAAVALATLAIATSACKSRPTRTLYVPGVRADLSLTLSYPPGVTATTACGGGAWILRLDTAAVPSWSWTLLFDHGLTNVYGAGTATRTTSASAGFGLDFRRVVRVEVERIAEDPSAVVAGNPVDVLCRGITDGIEVPGAITVDTSAQADPAPQPTRAPVKVDVTVDMLQIGASNRIADDGTLPQLAYPAAASLTSTRFGIGSGGTPQDPRGDVLIAGGETLTGFPGTIWKFSPRTLSITQTGTSLVAPRAGLTATAIDDNGPAVVFAGGYDGANLSLPNLDVVHPDGSIDGDPVALLHPHAFANAVYLPRDDHPALVIASGTDYFADHSGAWTTGTTARNDVDLIAPPGSDACQPGGDLSATTACTLGTDHLNDARGLSAAAGFRAPDGDRVWFAGGYAPADPTVPATTVEELFASLTTSGNLAAPTGFFSYGGDAAVLTSTGVPALDGRPIMAGGYAGGASPYDDGNTDGTKAIWVLKPGAGTSTSATKLTSQLGIARGQLRVAALRDGSMWIGGGRIPSAGTNKEQSAVEIFRPDSTAAGGTVTPAGKPGQMCPIGGGGGCGFLLAPRFGFAMVPLDGTRTWLDGALLIVGGAVSESGGTGHLVPVPGAPPAELWVPAYGCDAQGAPRSQNANPRPVAPLSNPSLAAPCDIGLVLHSLTDPRTGASVAVP